MLQACSQAIECRSVDLSLAQTREIDESRREKCLSGCEFLVVRESNFEVGGLRNEDEVIGRTGVRSCDNASMQDLTRCSIEPPRWPHRHRTEARLGTSVSGNPGNSGVGHRSTLGETTLGRGRIVIAGGAKADGAVDIGRVDNRSRKHETRAGSANECCRVRSIDA
jgi:hypothetical protein